jgi:hypothetical protein
MEDDSEEVADAYRKFCGLGVTYHALTDQGIQIKLIDSGELTAAKLAGLQDGDILNSIQTFKGWEPISSSNFYQKLGGVIGDAMPLRVIRGHPLRKMPDGAMRGHFVEPEGYQVDLDSAEILELEARRLIIYPGIPSTANRSFSLHDVPFRDLSEIEECFRTSGVTSEHVDLANLSVLSPAGKQDPKTAAQPSAA